MISETRDSERDTSMADYASRLKASYSEFFHFSIVKTVQLPYAWSRQIEATHGSHPCFCHPVLPFPCMCAIHFTQVPNPWPAIPAPQDNSTSAAFRDAQASFLKLLGTSILTPGNDCDLSISLFSTDGDELLFQYHHSPSVPPTMGVSSVGRTASTGLTAVR